MRRKRKFGLTVLSILLWVQLVFSVGITVWRYWLIGTGEAELFVSTSPERTEPLIDAVDGQCPSDMPLLYLGDEVGFYYTRYKLYPKKIVRLKSDWEDGADVGQIATFIEDELTDQDRDACLLIDHMPLGLQLQGEDIPVNTRQSIYIFRN
jgi:hypothetical protein